MAEASGENLMKDAQAVATSKIEEDETFFFLWTIEKYSMITAGEEKVRLESGIMRGGPLSNHSWQMKATFNRKSGDIKYMSLFLEFVDFGGTDNPSGNTENRKLPLKIQYSLLDTRTETPGLVRTSVCQMSKGSDWGYDKMCSSDSVAKHYLKDDTLRVHIQITIEGKLTTKIDQGAAVINQLTHRERRMQVTRRLYAESILTDVDVEGRARTFAAHKNILAGASSVFHAMFSHEMSEQKTNSVSIEDFEDDVINAMLEHIYNGETDLEDLEKTSKIIVIADKYNLPLLKEDCERRIIAGMEITVESAVDGLIAAHQYNSDALKLHLIKYIKRNLNAVKGTKAYKDLAKSPMVTILLDLI